MTYMNYPRDPATHASGRSVPRWAECVDAGGCAAAAHRRDALGRQALHGYEPTAHDHERDANRKRGVSLLKTRHRRSRHRRRFGGNISGAHPKPNQNRKPTPPKLPRSLKPKCERIWPLPNVAVRRVIVRDAEPAVLPTPVPPSGLGAELGLRDRDRCRRTLVDLESRDSAAPPPLPGRCSPPGIVPRACAPAGPVRPQTKAPNSP